jgi:hypothetical protein
MIIIQLVMLHNMRECVCVLHSVNSDGKAAAG